MSAEVSTKYRDWCWTLNNYTDDDRERLLRLDGARVYICYGVETGDNGTKHLQGFVQFNHPVGFRRVKEVMGDKCHLEQRRGTVRQAIEYCQKDGDFHDAGNPQRLCTSKEAQQEQWKDIIQLAESNRLSEIKEKYPSQYLRYLNTLRSLQKGSDLILDELTNEWWYGQTGTGKSSKVWADYPYHYQKELNKWWCGYVDQEIVVIEEWCPKNECTASQLKIWADRYPFTAQIKGGSLQKIRPKKIIVLSNYSIDQCFTNPEDAEPIKRRFKQVYFPFPIVRPIGLARPRPPLQADPACAGQALPPLKDSIGWGRQAGDDGQEPSETINTSDLEIDLDFLDELSTH